MAHPKRKHSQARGRKRRTHWKLSLPPESFCPKCNATKLPHRVCPECGHYGGEQVVAVKE